MASKRSRTSTATTTRPPTWSSTPATSRSAPCAFDGSRTSPRLERSAFREAYRNTHVLKAFVFFAFDHIARKGYDKAITHAQPKYARLWRIAFGFKNVEGKPPVYFDGHAEPYIELVKELTPPPNAISERTDATVLFRTEGYWDAPSEFETAAA